MHPFIQLLKLHVSEQLIEEQGALEEELTKGGWIVGLPAPSKMILEQQGYRTYMKMQAAEAQSPKERGMRYLKWRAL